MLLIASHNYLQHFLIKVIKVYRAKVVLEDVEDDFQIIIFKKIVFQGPGSQEEDDIRISE